MHVCVRSHLSFDSFTDGTIEDRIAMYRIQKSKNSESENNHITIMNTFWSTELKFRHILSHEGSNCALETYSDHFQSCKMEYRDKKSPQWKMSESKTTREYSLLRSPRDLRVGK